MNFDEMLHILRVQDVSDRTEKDFIDKNRNVFPYITLECLYGVWLNTRNDSKSRMRLAYLIFEDIGHFHITRSLVYGTL
jgi:hypothetical protein